MAETAQTVRPVPRRVRPGPAHGPVNPGFAGACMDARALRALALARDRRPPLACGRHQAPPDADPSG